MYGENESGKSTLQNFILFILFGLPPKQREFYRPKTSGKMGGRLTIIDSTIGEYTIERLDEVQKGAARCYTADGQEFGEAWLKDRLQGMTKDIYQSVYSFSALDLSHFKNMKDEDIGEILLGIGLTGSNNIHAIEKQLDQKIGELFKPTGKIPVINQQLESLDEVFTELTNYKNNEASYQSKQEQMDTIGIEIDQLQTKLQKTKEINQTIERYQHNLPVINDYHMYVNQLENYPSELIFPENGLERLNQLKEKLMPLQSELSILKVNQTKNKTEQIKLKEQQLDEHIYEEAQEILFRKNDYYENNKELQNYEDKVKAIKLKLDTELDKLNVGLTYDELANVPLPFYIEEEWNELRKETDRLNLEKEQLLQEQIGLKKQQAFLSSQVTEINKELLTPEQLEEIYSQLDIYKELNYKSKLIDEASKKKKKWEKEKVAKEKRILSLLIGSLIIGMLAGGLGLLLDFSFLYNLMTIIVILGIGQWVLGKKTIKETGHLLDNHETSQESIIITESQKQTAEELLMKHDENRTTLASLKDRLKSLDIQFIQLEEKNNGLKHREVKMKMRIEAQVEQYPFLNNIELNYWSELYRTIKELLNLLQEEQIFHQKINKINENIQMYYDEILTFLNKIDQAIVHQSLDFRIEIIEDIVRIFKEKKQEIKRYDEEIIENNNQQEATSHKMNIYEREINELFALAQVNSEDEFYKKANMRLEKQKIEREIQRTSEQLQAIFSQSMWISISKNKPDQSKLEVEEQHTTKTIQEIERNIHVKRQQLADLNADLKNMESSETYSKTMHQYTMDKERLAKLAKEWAVLKTAKEMLAETKRKYRDKYLTDVMDRTSIFFKKITMNAYENIIPPQDGKKFQVETIDRMRYEINELSQGTVDQLYVCLRLAICDIMNEDNHLPFIIDDAFVHFDAPRTQQMTEILTEIGQRQQIILFTCRLGVVNSIPGTHIVNLETKVQVN